MTIAKKMASFAFALRLSDVPPEIERAARRHIADSLACALGAHGFAPVRALLDYARASRADGLARVVGYGDRTSPAMAALVNGAMVRYLDANDISSFGGGHFSDGVPPLLAVAQQRGASADDFVEAVVALYETQGALARAFDFMPRGYHALTQIPWTAPIAAARLMGAGESAAVSAAGLSGSMGMALNTWLKPTGDIPSIKAVAVGLAGQRAVESAELAARGITAPPDALEFALENLAKIGGPAPDFAPFDRLGADWSADRHIIKSYPSQIYTQAAVQAALALREIAGGGGAVERATLYGHRHVCGGVQGSAAAFRPRSREAADHSTPFVMASALLNGKLTPAEFEGEAWKSPEVRAMMDRLTLVIDPERDRAFAERGVYGVRLEARLTDGREETVKIRQPKGHPDDPLADAELTDKIAWLTERLRLPAPAADFPRALFAHCMNMSTERDLERLGEMLRAGE